MTLAFSRSGRGFGDLLKDAEVIAQLVMVAFRSARRRRKG